MAMCLCAIYFLNIQASNRNVPPPDTPPLHAGIKRPPRLSLHLKFHSELYLLGLFFLLLPIQPHCHHPPCYHPFPASPSLLHPKRGWSLITHLNASAPTSPYAPLFARRSPERLPTGSILTVITYTDASRQATSPFSGILMGVRRGSSSAVDTAFRLRNIVSRTGVEMTFKVSSPMIKEIKVLQRAGEGGMGGIKDLKRAKVNYLRERPAVMAGIARALKSAKQQAAREAEEAARAAKAAGAVGA